MNKATKFLKENPDVAVRAAASMVSYVARRSPDPKIRIAAKLISTGLSGLVALNLNGAAKSMEQSEPSNGQPVPDPSGTRYTA